MPVVEQVAFELKHSRPGLAVGVEIWIDSHCVYNENKQTNSLKFVKEFEADPGMHQLRIVMKNKTPFHTKIDSQNRIVSDCVLTIEDFQFNQIYVQKMLLDHGLYYIKNQNTTRISDSVGVMAHNGELVLNFSTPVEEWMILNYNSPGPIAFELQ
jgi:hypothetical protein